MSFIIKPRLQIESGNSLAATEPQLLIYEFNSRDAECSNRKKRCYNDIKGQLHILHKNTKTL